MKIINDTCWYFYYRRRVPNNFKKHRDLGIYCFITVKNTAHRKVTLAVKQNKLVKLPVYGEKFKVEWP